jgi:integrase
VAGRRGFGRIRQFRSGRWQASYTAPDGILYIAPSTFDAKMDAEAWLTDRRREIDRAVWSPPVDKPAEAELLLVDYADAWLEQRTLKPRTKAHYRAVLDAHVLPKLGTVALSALTPAQVRTWHASVAMGKATTRAHAYGLLRTILGTALGDGLINANPCAIRGAGYAKRVHRVQPATLPEIEALTAAMPERLQALVLLSAWCGLRYGESTELRRGDVDLAHGVLRVRRGVVRVDGGFVVGTPKSDAGVRDVAIPPHLLPLIEHHLSVHVEKGRDALLFPAQHGGHLAPSALYRSFYPAREKAGRPDLRWHDLRHTGAVLAASTGATLAELMARLGHSTPQAALRYQHAAQGRDQEIAKALSALAAGTHADGG